MARRGEALHKVAWTIAPNPALTELRRAFSLDAAARHRVIADVAHRLHMPRMARFVERMADDLTPGRRPGREGSDILDLVTLGELARRLECPVEGDAAIEIRRVAKIEDAGPGDLTFLANPKYASKLASTRASAVIMNGADASLRSAPCAVIRSASPYLTFARAAQVLSPSAGGDRGRASAGLGRRRMRRSIPRRRSAPSR